MGRRLQETFDYSKNSSSPACEDGIECSETSAYKPQTPGNYPKESIQHLEHGESLKSRIFVYICGLFTCDFIEEILWAVVKTTV
jgi:hypothetical protein